MAPPLPTSGDVIWFHRQEKAVRKSDPRPERGSFFCCWWRATIVSNKLSSHAVESPGKKLGERMRGLNAGKCVTVAVAEVGCVCTANCLQLAAQLYERGGFDRSNGGREEGRTHKHRIAEPPPAFSWLHFPPAVLTRQQGWGRGKGQERPRPQFSPPPAAGI